MQQSFYRYILRLADNSLVLGQRLAELVSRGPILEEDLAMTNLSLDLFGQAESLYELAASLDNGGKSADDLAFLRDERNYYNNILVEQPNGDFACTMLRHYLYSAYACSLYEKLSATSNEILQGLSIKFLKEMKYHLRHSAEWVIRLGQGTEESKRRTQVALDELWRYTADMFEATEDDQILADLNLGVNVSGLKDSWLFKTSELLNEAGLTIPDYKNRIVGGHRGIHSEHLGHLLCEMQYLQRSHPGARW